MSRSSHKIPVALLGATGLVGQQFVRMLGNHPFFDVEALLASPRSEGKKYSDAVSWVVGGDVPAALARRLVESLDIESLKERGIAAVFSALPARLAKSQEASLRRAGMAVFSNASTFRTTSDVPILIPEVNHEHLVLAKRQKNRFGGCVVTNSNCTTSGLTMTLKPLIRFGIRRVDVVTFQAVSGAGTRGVAGMDILGNVLPYIHNEEEKVEQETGIIMGSTTNGRLFPWPIPVSASCCRVPVRDGHLECVRVEFENAVSKKELIAAFKKFSGIPQAEKLPTAPAHPIVYLEEPDRPQPLRDNMRGDPHRARGMAVAVGRLRIKDNTARYFLLVHNTIRGAAGNSILNAEFAVNQGLLG